MEVFNGLGCQRTLISLFELEDEFLVSHACLAVAVWCQQHDNHTVHKMELEKNHVTKFGFNLQTFRGVFFHSTRFTVAAGVVIKPITAKIGNGFALPPIAEFKRLITPRTRAIMICNPNNPTGYLYSKEELEQLKDIVLEHDLFLFVDEVYRDFCYDGKKHFSVLNISGLEEHVIVIDSVSKRFSMCGARVGNADFQE